MGKKKSMNEKIQSTIDNSKQAARVQQNLWSTEPGHLPPNRPHV
ncbi:hypothetical protein [Paenibacillus hexagrammi]|nr:hypothetical protein [Paenibacillus sp. YPD9-1]